MPVYECPRCGYKSHIKTYLSKHFKRKNICPAISSDKSIEECIQEVLGSSNEDVIKCNHGVTKCNPKNVINCNPNVISCNPNVIPNKDKVITEGFNCKYCDSFFTKRQNKWRHEKTCKEKHLYSLEEVNTIMKDRDIIIDELRKQIELLLQNRGNTTHTTNNTNNYTQNNYIVINAFGNENLKYITKNDINKLIAGSPMSSIPNLLKQIHFNPDHRENHNIKIPNKKNSLTKIYDGEKNGFFRKNKER